MHFLRCSAVMCGLFLPIELCTQDVHARESFLRRRATFLVLIVKIIHYAAVAVLVLGVLYYLWMKPPTLILWSMAGLPKLSRWCKPIGRWAIPQFFRP